jgi:hypothetical protein
MQFGKEEQMREERPDFVKVKLTEFGEQLAGEGTLTVIAGQHEYEFTPGEAREDITLAFDWNKVLANEFRDGKPLFEIVE